MFNLIILRGQKNQNLALKIGSTNIKIYFHAKKIENLLGGLFGTRLNFGTLSLLRDH